MIREAIREALDNPRRTLAEAVVLATVAASMLALLVVSAVSR